MQTAMESVKQGLGISPPNLLSGINVEKMHEIRDSLKTDPSLAKLKYHINFVAERDLKVVAEMNRFELGRNTYKHSTTFKEYFDQPKQILGQDSAPSPTEHLLSALGGCLTMSLLKVAACDNVALRSVKCKVKGKVDLRSAFSDEFQDITPGLKAVCAKFEIQGMEDIDRACLNKLIQKAQRHSVVTQTLKRGTQVCVCLKGEERAFEIQHGLASEEAVRGREGISPQREFGVQGGVSSPQRGVGAGVSGESIGQERGLGVGQERGLGVGQEERKPGFMEKAKEAYEHGKEQVSESLGIGQRGTSDVGVSGRPASATSDLGGTFKSSDVSGITGRPAEGEETIGRYSESKLDEGEFGKPSYGAEKSSFDRPIQSPGREQQRPIGTEMKEPGALKEKGLESGVGPTGRISEVTGGLGSELSGAKKETTR